MAFCVEHRTLPPSLSPGMKSILRTSFSTFVLSLCCHLLLLSSHHPLFYLSVFLSHSPHPEVQRQVHLGRYGPAEGNSPPLRAHLSLSASLSSSTRSSFTLIIIGPERRIIALLPPSPFVLPSSLPPSTFSPWPPPPSFTCIFIFLPTFPQIHICSFYHWPSPVFKVQIVGFTYETDLFWTLIFSFTDKIHRLSWD